MESLVDLVASGGLEVSANLDCVSTPYLEIFKFIVLQMQTYTKLSFVNKSSE